MPVTLTLPTRRQPWTQADAGAIAEAVRDTIVERTKGGVGSDGRVFKPKQDGSASRLVDSGELLNSIKARVSNGHAEVVATAEHAVHVERERPFLGLTDAEQAELAERLEGMVGEALGAEPSR